MGKCTLLVLTIVALLQVNALAVEAETDKSNKVTTLEDMVAISPIRRSRRSIAPMSAADQDIIVDLHNGLRRRENGSNMDHMTWDTNLADMAADWAETCYWGHGQPHREPSEMPFSHIGQNLYYTTNINISLEHALMNWFNEKPNYNYELTQCMQGMCGHYTQMVWSDSKVIGCAVHRCTPLANAFGRDVTYLVCNYGPSGNFAGRKPYSKVGDACTTCASGSGICDDGLCRKDCIGPTCQCKMQCHNCGRLASDTCSCTCPLGWKGASCADQCTDHGYCGDNPGFPKRWCTDNIHTFVHTYCPLMCGKCGSDDVRCDDDNVL